MVEQYYRNVNPRLPRVALCLGIGVRGLSMRRGRHSGPLEARTTMRVEVRQRAAMFDACYRSAAEKRRVEVSLVPSQGFRVAVQE